MIILNTKFRYHKIYYFTLTLIYTIINITVPKFYLHFLYVLNNNTLGLGLDTIR